MNTNNPDECSKEVKNNFFSLQIRLSDQKLTLIMKDFAEGVVYQKQYTQFHIRNGCFMTLEDIFQSIKQSKSHRKIQQVDKKGNLCLYVNSQYGQINKQNGINCYKIDRGGNITVYMPLVDRRNGKQKLYQYQLKLNKQRQISEMQIIKQRHKFQISVLKQNILVQKQKDQEEKLQIKRKIIQSQQNYKNLVSRIQNIQNNAHQSNYRVKQIPQICNNIQGDKNYKYLLDWDLYVYPKSSQQNYAKIFNQQFRCSIGKNGATAWKKEGDGKTPVGTFRLREIWVRTDRVSKDIHDILVNTGLPVFTINPYDGWCDQPTSSQYNKHVDLRYFDTKISHQNLWREDNLYDWFIVVGYNDNPVVPGKGSAIFIHTARQNYPGTAGCVAFSRSDFVSVMKLLKAYSVITIYDQSAVQQRKLKKNLIQQI